MKRLLSILLFATMLGTLLPTVQASVSNYKWTFEDFESSDVQITSSNASASWTAGGAGDSAGCVHVKASKDYGTIKFPSYIEQGKTYKLSAWVKIAGTIPTSQNFQFLFYMHSVDSSGVVSEGMSAYKTVTASGVPYSADWEYLETTFTHDGKGRIAGQGDVNVADGESTVEIRIGDGKMSTSTNGDPFDYYIDDFTVEPIFEQGADTHIDTSIGLKNGNFNYGYDESCWSTTNNTTATAIDDGYIEGGVRITSPGNYGAFRQRAPMEYNKTYRISLFARAGDSDTVGKPLKLILDREQGKTDTSITENFEYLPDVALSSNTQEFVLSDSWQQLEVIYKASKATFETNKPYIYPRVGNGTTAYCLDVDEWEVEELSDAFYNGDFDKTIGAEWTLNGTTAVLTNSDDAPSDYTTSGNFVGKGYGTYFSQGIHIAKGEHCKISFWAKSNKTDLNFTPVLLRDTSSTEYLYADGKSALNNDSSLTKSVMTTDWQRFEFDYTEATGVSQYRVPIFYLRCGERSTEFDYNVTGFSIERDNEDDPGDEPIVETEPRVASMATSGRSVEADTITFSAVTEDAASSFYRILKEFKTGYVCMGSGEFVGDDVSYIAKTTDVGSKLRFMVVPLSANGTPGKYRFVETNKIMALLNIEPSLNADFSSTTKATVKVSNNDSASASLFAVLAMFDDNNAMCAYISKGATLSSNESDTISLDLDAVAGATRARLFVWSGADEFSTKGKALLANLNEEQ